MTTGRLFGAGKVLWGGAAGLLLLLAACATPLEQCIARAGAELGFLEEELAERRLNIARGYAIRRQPVVDWMPSRCLSPVTGVFYTCMEPVERMRETRREINPADEQERIAQLERAIARERARLPAAQARCRAEFPEA